MTRMTNSISTNERERSFARAQALVEAQDNFIDALIRLREQHGMTIEALAEKIGTTPEEIEKFEDDDANPTLQDVQLYALGVRAHYRFELLDDCVGQAEISWKTASAYNLIMRDNAMTNSLSGDCTNMNKAWTTTYEASQGAPLRVVNV